MNKTFVMSLIASSFLFTACTEEQVNSTIIGIGIGVGVVAIVDELDGHNDHRHQPRHDDRRDDRRDDRHDDRHDDRRDDRRDGHRLFMANMNVNTEALQAIESASAVASFAEKHHISIEASSKIQEAFTSVGEKGVSSFETIGLTARDLKQIAKKDLPSANSIKVMSVKLNLSEAQSTDLVKSMIAEFTRQSASVDSPYWQSCMASGKWRTAQNNYCSNTAWNGCSPATGATACY